MGFGKKHNAYTNPFPVFVLYTCIGNDFQILK